MSRNPTRVGREDPSFTRQRSDVPAGVPSVSSPKPSLTPAIRSAQIGYWVFIKWAAMIAAIAWILMYQLSEHAARMPGFVYANF
jgi:hypothetical protein